MTTYIIDKIRQIAIWETGDWYNVAASPSYVFTEVDTVQECREFVEFNGTKYPVAIVGDGRSPIIPGDYIESNSVEEIRLHKGIKRIAHKAFSHYIFNDAQIQLPESLLEIGDEAFLEAKIEKIVIPQNVVYVGENAFAPETEVVCLSPFLVREDDNRFVSKKFEPEGSPLQYRVTDPIRKEVSVCKFIGKDGKDLVFPDTVNIEGVDYLVTGIDCDFGDDVYGNFVLPPHLRKIGHDFYTNYGTFHLPDTVKYIGHDAITIGGVLHLPEGLRFIGRGIIASQIASSSPYIDAENQLVVDKDGEPLYYFGDDKVANEVRTYSYEPILVKDSEGCYFIVHYDYEDYADAYWYKETLDSSTF